MTDRLQFWQKHLRTLSDADLCAVKTRGMKRDELCALLEVMCERRYHTTEGPIREWRRFEALCDIWFRKWSPFCVDCGVDVHEIGEYFIVHNTVWNSAWLGRYRSPIGDGQLCIGCLERRLGRTLMACDFADAPVNDVRRFSQRSDRLCNRLTTKTGSIKSPDGPFGFLVEKMLENLPEDRRAAARAAWYASADEK
jgi:hypothetical protein